MITKKIKVCTGCGHRSDSVILYPHLSCCPDSRYVSFGEIVNEYLINAAW